MDTHTAHPAGGRRFGPSSRSAVRTPGGQQPIGGRGVRFDGASGVGRSGVRGLGSGVDVVTVGFDVDRPTRSVAVLDRPMADRATDHRPTRERSNPRLPRLRATSVSTGSTALAERPLCLTDSVGVPTPSPVRVPTPSDPAGRPERRRARRSGHPAARRPPAGVVEVRPMGIVGCPESEDVGPGYRMSRWARLGMTLAVSAALVVGVITVMSRGGSAGTEYVTVGPGETIWSVAARTAPDRDPRDVVADLITLNGLRDGEVHVGEVLRAPAG